MAKQYNPDPFTEDAEKEESPAPVSTPGPASDPYFQQWKQQQQGAPVNPSSGAVVNQGPVAIDPKTGLPFGQTAQTSPTTPSARDENWAGQEIWETEPNAYLVLKNGGLMGDTKDPLLKIKDVMWRFYRWDDAQVQKMGARLEATGRFDGITANSTRAQIWDALYVIVLDAAKMYAADPDKAPTLDLLLKNMEKNPISGAATGTPASLTTTSVNITDPKSAKGLLERTLTEQLGRAPTKAEHAAFLAALNTEERDNPSVTTQTFDQATGRATSVVSSGGMDELGRASFADDFVQGDAELEKERRTYQAATTYMAALESALGATVQ